MTPSLNSVAANRLIQRAGWVACIAAIIMIIVKAIAWLMTGSVVMLTSLVDSMMDAVAAGLNLCVLRYAGLPADHNHRYGHGKAESLAALMQAMFVAGSAIFLILQAVERLMNPRVLTLPEVGIWMMLFSLFLTGIVLLYQQRVIRLTQSTAIRALALNFTMDIIITVMVIITLIFSGWGWLRIDPIMALAMGALILFNAYQIGMDAIYGLMDTELPDDIREHMLQIIFAIEGIQGVHAFRTRQSGRDYFVDMHVELSEMLSFREAHDISVHVIRAIQASYPQAEVFVHQDPMPFSSAPPVLRLNHPE